MNILTGGIVLEYTLFLKFIKEFNFKALEFCGKSFFDFMDAVERAAIRNILESTNGNVSAAARFLGMDRRTLATRIKRLGVNNENYYSEK